MANGTALRGRLTAKDGSGALGRHPAPFSANFFVAVAAVTFTSPPPPAPHQPTGWMAAPGLPRAVPPTPPHTRRQTLARTVLSVGDTTPSLTRPRTPFLPKQMATTPVADALAASATHRHAAATSVRRAPTPPAGRFFPAAAADARPRPPPAGNPAR